MQLTEHALGVMGVKLGYFVVPTSVHKYVHMARGVGGHLTQLVSTH